MNVDMLIKQNKIGEKNCSFTHFKIEIKWVKCRLLARFIVDLCHLTFI